MLVRHLFKGDRKGDVMEHDKDIESYQKELAAERAEVEKFRERGNVSEENRQLNIERIRAEKFREWDWTELNLYLRYDYWKATDGLAVLAGCRYPYGGDTMLDYDEPVHRDCPSHGELCADRYAQLCGIWERSKLSDNEERHGGNCDIFDREYSPVYFIEWALSKKLRIDWLDWAIERGLYIPIKKAEATIKKIDLIDLISLSKIIVEQESMAIGEAFHYVYTILKKNADKIKLFDTSPATLPQEIKDADNILQEVWNTNWWRDEKLETASFNAFAPSVHEVAILKTEASKAFTIPFDVFAHGLCNTLQVVEQPAQSTGTNKIAPADNAAPLAFDQASATYPPELDIAVQAWRAVSTTEGKGKPKARIKAWLDTNTKLSNEAKERIAIVTNWEKTGGATRTE